MASRAVDDLVDEIRRVMTSWHSGFSLSPATSSSSTYLSTSDPSWIWIWISISSIKITIWTSIRTPIYYMISFFRLSTSTTTSTTCAVGFLFLYEQWGSMHKRVVFFVCCFHFCWLINDRWHDMNWCDIFWVDKFVSFTPYNVCCRFNNISYFFILSPDAAHTCCLLSLTKSTDSYLALQ